VTALAVSAAVAVASDAAVDALPEVGALAAGVVACAADVAVSAAAVASDAVPAAGALAASVAVVALVVAPLAAGVVACAAEVAVSAAVDASGTAIDAAPEVAAVAASVAVVLMSVIEPPMRLRLVLPPPDDRELGEAARFVCRLFPREIEPRQGVSRRRRGAAVSENHAEAPAVVIADGDRAERARLSRVLAAAGFRVVETSEGEEAVAAARHEAPAIVVLEVPLDGISGYEVCRLLREERGDDVAIVFLSGTRTESYDRVAGLLLGADDYLVKPYAVDELLARLRLLSARRQAPSRTLSQLTRREREVLALLAGGLSAKEIAASLVISTKTVGTHIEHILVKLNVRSRVQAVAIAFREGLTPPEATAPGFPAAENGNNGSSAAPPPEDPLAVVPARAVRQRL
jgi:DNA-binding NarL/FixJ family response regulator